MRNVHRGMDGKVIGGMTAEGKGIGTKAGRKRGLSGRGLSVSTPGLDRQNEKGIGGGSSAKAPVAAPAANRHWSEMVGGGLPQKSGGLGSGGGSGSALGGVGRGPRPSGYTPGGMRTMEFVKGWDDLPPAERAAKERADMSESGGGGGGTPGKVGGLGGSGGVDVAGRKAFAEKLRGAKASGRWDRSALRSEAAALGISNKDASKYWGSLPGANRGVARLDARVAEKKAEQKSAAAVAANGGRPVAPSIKGRGENGAVTRGDFDEYSQKHGSEKALSEMGKRLDGYAADRSSKAMEESMRVARDRGPLKGGGSVGGQTAARPAAPESSAVRPKPKGGDGRGISHWSSLPPTGAEVSGAPVDSGEGADFGRGFTPTLRDTKSGIGYRKQNYLLGKGPGEDEGHVSGEQYFARASRGAEIRKREFAGDGPAWAVAAKKKKKKGSEEGVRVATR